MDKLAFILLLLAACTIMGCGSSQPDSDATSLYNDAKSPGVVEPKDDTERQILDAVAQMAIGDSKSIGKHKVTVRDSYFAASGRECKAIVIGGTSDESHRLVCKINDSWQFAPNVYPGSGQAKAE